ncbi:bifunctional serine/threonine-protein kinase/formylglycine-generating enzyme family protein [Colwellia sp. TT2012]|uniref:bifunctional serine/threonine-protein kinase/formylglycine-generating enzyme family protein n=1 Tax=Colwellia sp. TT2012 TaxID=1720342 RepID=UPI0007088E3C|nr:bifunctional serine/threonine-protein kinase/formylglycine-generating enzyme family protein [Colwellia sp. TT2012]
MQHIGKYKVIKKIGSGSFGCVYLAEDAKLAVQVAIKVFKIKDAALISQVTSAVADPEHIIKQRFIEEARILRKLSANPYIVEMYEFDELADGTPYYVMPYIARTLVDEIGKDYFSPASLDDIPKTHYPRRMPTIAAIRYLTQLSQALAAVHEHGLVHRDIKPENILINDQDQVQLSDFGIAKLPLSEHSQTGFGMGSKNYLSPEQQESAKHVQAASDIYSLAVIAYRMFTGQLPVGRFQDPIDYAPDIPQALNDLIILALSQSALQRPSDGSEFLVALKQALEESMPAEEINTEHDTKTWIGQSSNPIKDELKPLANKIIELLTEQGEIKTDDLIFLQAFADIADLDNLALQAFIAHITQQQIAQQQMAQHKSIIPSDLPCDIPSKLADETLPNNSNNLSAFILWMETVNKHFHTHQQFLSAAQVNSLIAAGLSTTNKTAEQLTLLIALKQQKPSAVKRIKTLAYPYFSLLNKRRRLISFLLFITAAIVIYGKYQSHKKQYIANDYAWSQAQSSNTVSAYNLYLAEHPEGGYLNEAKQALADLLRQRNLSQTNESLLRQQQITTVQQQLIKLGYQISKSGKLDKRSQHAIKAFEDSENLLITGNVDELLLQKLTQVYQQKDETLWLAVQDEHAIHAYQQYKDAFPQGQHFIQATQLINQLSLEKSANDEKKQQAKAKHRQQIIQRATNELLNNMVTLPAGHLVMGCGNEEHCKSKEMPQHSVTINTFSIMVTEVTFAQWDACIIAGACNVQPDDENWGRGSRPVINISYDDIVAEFIPWLNKTTGESFVLPSESQWEYAAKAASITKYAWGDELDCLTARYSQFSGLCGNERKTSVVKSFQQNAFGLYDMHGNVWEWTQDCWNEDYYAAPSDGSAWQVGDCSAGIIRGGSWLNEANVLRSTFRRGYSRSAKTNVTGFRLVINTH